MNSPKGRRCRRRQLHDIGLNGLLTALSGRSSAVDRPERTAGDRLSPTAIGHQKLGEILHPGEFRTVDDRPAATFGCDQSGAAEHRQMGGHGVRGRPHRLGDLAGRQTRRLMADQKAECFQPGGLGEGGEGGNGVCGFHGSTIFELSHGTSLMVDAAEIAIMD